MLSRSREERTNSDLGEEAASTQRVGIVIWGVAGEEFISRAENGLVSGEGEEFRSPRPKILKGFILQGRCSQNNRRYRYYPEAKAKSTHRQQTFKFGLLLRHSS